MTPRVAKTPLARRDLVEQAEYIARDSLAAAERFLDAAEAAFALLSRMPGMGTRCQFISPEAAGVRVWPIRGFENHVIFYRPAEGGIDVVRVLHAARDMEAVFFETPEPRE